MNASAPRRSIRPRSTLRPQNRAQRVWWSLCATLLIMAVGGFLVTDAGAARAQDDTGTALVVDRIDATGDDVQVEGSLVGAGVDSLELSSEGDAVATTSVKDVAGGVRNEVVVVIDNASALGNATVQLAKSGLAPLMPGNGAVATLGVVSTGGGAAVETGPTSSTGQIESGLAGIAPRGTSATWDGLVRAAELLDDRDEGSVGTVVLFAASPSNAVGAGASAAESALQRAGVRLDVVAIPQGADLTTLSAMVDDLGGSIDVVDDDEALAAAYEDVAAHLAGRFEATFAPIEGTAGQVPLTVASGDTRSVVSYTPDTLRTGVVGLAPVTHAAAEGASLLSGGLAKLVIIACSA